MKSQKKKETWEEQEQEEMALLKSLSMYDELITSSHFKEEVDGRVRQLCFLDMKSEIAQHYYELNKKNKIAIGKMVETLTKGRDHQGFNLKVYLYNATKDIGGGIKITQTDYMRQIIDRDITDLIGFDNGRTGDKKATPTVMNHRFKYFKTTAKFSNRYLIPTICDDLLVSQELILTGRGFIESIKDEILQMYLDDTGFQEKTRSDPYPSVKEEYTKFAEYIGKTWGEIVDKEYVVINYTLGYELLDKSPIKGAKELVDYMIEELYSQQKEHEKIEAALFEQMLINGGAIKIDPDENPDE